MPTETHASFLGTVEARLAPTERSVESANKNFIAERVEWAEKTKVKGINFATAALL